MPGTVRICKVDVTVKPFLYVCPVGELQASVTGNGPHKAGGGNAESIVTMASSIVDAFLSGSFIAV